MESNQQAWRMRFSYRNATMVVCFINLVAALLLLRGFLAASPNRRATRPGHPDPELMRYILESEEIRHAMEPLELIKRLRELEQESYTEPETVQPIAPKKTAAADLSKRLQDFRALNDANNQKALEEWRKRKIERERARRESEKNATAVAVCDPAVSVYKGYSLSKETEEYLASHGLKNTVYSINSVDLKEDLFGTLAPCPIQEPDVRRLSIQKRLKDEDATKSHQMTDPSTKHPKLIEPVKEPSLFSSSASCILEFDGASKGNPGKAGAGAVLRSEDGSVVCRLREGLGIATNNEAEYGGIILGMKYALKKGFKHIRIQGDSQLVCNQVQDIWQTKKQNLIELYKEAKELKSKFDTCQICAVAREFNSDADREANFAVHLQSGEVYDSSATD